MTKTLYLIFGLTVLSSISFSQVRFQRIYQANSDELGYYSCKTLEGGYIIGGYTSSFGNGKEIILIKIDSIGDVLWTKTFGGTGDDILYGIKQTSDSCYILIANSNSFSGDDAIVVKLNKSGNILWARKLDCGSHEDPTNIIELTNGSYVVAGGGGTPMKIFVAKLTSSGSLCWFKRYCYNNGTGTGIQQTPDGGFIVSGNYSQDYFLMKLDSLGGVTWAKSYNGGTSNEVSYVLTLANDGGYLMTGDTWSFSPNCKVWQVKTDNSGNIQWEKSYGIPGKDLRGFSIQKVGNYGYAFVAVDFTSSTNDDGYLIKIDNSGNIIWSRKYMGSNDDKLRNVLVTNDKGFLLTGYSNSFVGSGYNIYVVKTDSNGYSNMVSCNQSNINFSVSIPTVTPVNRTISVDIFTNCVSITPSIVTRAVTMVPLCQISEANFYSDRRIICPGGTVNYFDSSLFSPISWRWVFNGATPNTSTQKNPVKIKYNNAGTYNVRLIASNVYGLDTIIKNSYITVLSAPKTGFSVNDTDQCLLSNQFIFTNTTTSYSGNYLNKWNFGDGNTSTNKNPGYFYSLPGIYFVKLITTSDSGCSDSIVQRINVIEEPEADFMISDTIQCLKGNNFIFKDSTLPTSGSYNYLWHFSDGNLSTSGNTNHTYLTYGTFNIKMVVNNSAGCKDSITKTIHIKPSPIANFTFSDSIQCLKTNQFSFSNTSTINTGSYTDNWYFGDGDTSTNKNPFHTYNNPGTFNVKLKLISDLLCPDSFIRTVYVISNPSIPVLSSNNPLCEGDTLKIIPDILAGSTYRWTGPHGFSSTQKDIIIVKSKLQDNGLYQVIRTRNGCESDTAKINIIVKLVPDTSIVNVTSNSPVCEGDTLKLNANNIPGYDYNWNGPAGFSSSLITPQKWPFNFSDTGNFSLVLDLNGCKSKTIKTNVGIKSRPVATSSNNSPLCEGSTLGLYGNFIVGGIYNWIAANGFRSTMQNPIINNITLSDTGFYNLVIRGINGCVSLSAVTQVIIQPAPDTPFVSGKFILCEGEILEFNTLDVPNGNFIWSGPLGYKSNIQSPIIEPIKKSHSGLYKVYVKVYNCKSDETRLIVQINENPQLTLGEDTKICIGEKIILDGGIFNEYLWQDSSITRQYNVTSPGIYWLIVKNQFGCVSADTIEIVEECPPNLYIPNSFSPNNDGINESFEVKGQNIIEYEIMIYDRWGEQIFINHDLNQSWDGTYKGKMCPVGVYYWMINHSSYWNKMIIRGVESGTMTLLR